MKISPEEALKYLDTVVSKSSGTREDHEVLKASVQILTQIIVEWRSLSPYRNLLQNPSTVPGGKSAEALKKLPPPVPKSSES